MLLLGGAESMPKGIPRQGHVAIGAPSRETNDAQLFAQKRSMLQGQTDQRSRLLHCQTDLTAPTSAMIPVFHGISRAEGPFKQTRRVRLVSRIRCWLDSSNADGSNGQPAACIAFPIFRRAAFRSTGKLCSGQRRTEALATWPSRTLRLLWCTESQTPTRS